MSESKSLSLAQEITNEDLHTAQDTTTSTESQTYIINPSKIRLKLPKENPIVVLLGAAETGKTAFLRSLIYYTRRKGSYSFVVEKDSLEDAPEEYWTEAKRLIDGATGEQAHAPSDIFFLSTAYLKNNPQFYLLETKGEHFFSETDIERVFPHYAYLHALIESVRETVFLIFFTPKMFNGDKTKTDAYCRLVNSLLKRLNPKYQNAHIVVSRINDKTLTKKERELTETEVQQLFEADGRYEIVREGINISQVTDINIIPYVSLVHANDDPNQVVFRENNNFTENMLKILNQHIQGKGMFQTLKKAIKRIKR